MSGLAESYPAFQVGGQVTPNEIDRYEVYQILGPMIGTFIWGTAEGTSTQTPTVAFSQVLPDYPRSVTVKLLPESGSTAGGTLVLTGKDQFGNTQTESFGIATAANGGTTAGTKIFAKFTSAAATLATMNAGVGTFSMFPSSTGTTALFGLPSKIASTADVKMFTFGSTGVAKAVNGGTFGAFIDTTVHAIKAPNTLTTPAADLTWISVWFKPTWVNTQRTNLASLNTI